MRVFLSISFLLGFAILEEEVCYHATNLDSTNVTEHISKYKTTFMLYYADWCGHCKQFMPDYDLLCKNLNENFEESLLCGRLNCAKNEKVCTDEKLKGYPTVKAMRSDFTCEYKGSRASKDIFKWARSIIFSFEDLTDFDKLNEIMNEGFTVVAYFVTDHPSRAISQSIVCEMASLNFVTISDEAIAEKLNIQRLNSYNIFENGEFKASIENVDDIDDIMKQIFVLINPLLPDYSQETSNQIFTQGLRYYLAFLYDSLEDLEKYSPILKEYAESKLSDIRVFTINKNELSNQGVVNYLQVESFPFVALYDDKEQNFYHFSGDSFTVETFNDFVTGCQNGSIMRFIMRQPVPEDWDKGIIKQLVYDNFDSVFETFEGGAVIFYAPWCSHCSAFLPHWEEIAKNITEKHPNLFFGKLDHTQNEIPDIDVKEYPTIIAFKSRNEFETFKDERTPQNVTEFVLNYLVPSYKVPEIKEEVKTEEKHEEL